MKRVEAARKLIGQVQEQAKRYWLHIAYSLAVSAIVWAIGIGILVPYAKTWAQEAGVGEWEITVTMLIILIVITVLSNLPLLIFLAFDGFRKKSVLNQAKSELRHYHMGYLVREMASRFNAAHALQNYKVPIPIATLAMTVGWGLFFFSEGAEVVPQLSTGRISILFFRLAYADPVVLGFLGAFFFSLQMMLRRFFTGDIRPSVFMHIGVRTWLVIVLTIALGAIWTWPGRVDGALAPRWLLAVSFVGGVFPNVLFDFIRRAAAPLGQKAHMLSITGSLDRIRGLNVWRQARLAEEGIDSLESLATSDVVGLIANTRLGTMCLLHWVDQALLAVHGGESNLERFFQAGICTATAFECVYAGQLKENEREELEKDRGEGKLRTYMGRRGLTSVPEAPSGLAESLGNEDGWAERLRNIVIAICDDVNYQRLWAIRHGSMKNSKPDNDSVTVAGM